ncbi:DUF1266 domain-containing protein [Pontiella agarivorans]|nr:DUF1266 domain-containing protein [Pontiella agarivorans]
MKVVWVLVAVSQTIVAQKFYSAEQKQWALAVSAILTERNQEDLFALTGAPQIQLAVDAKKETLVTWWSVDSRKELLEVMRWARDEGHRAVYERIHKNLDKAGWWPGFQYKIRNAMDPQYQYRCNFVMEHKDDLKAEQLVAWDIGRVVSLARWGVLCGYLQEEEAWNWIMEAAQQLQQRYSSWEEFATNYLLGREFSTRYRSTDAVHLYHKAAFWNLNNVYSPWKCMEWDLDLSGSNVKPESAELPNVSDYYLALEYDWDDSADKAVGLLKKVAGKGESLYRGLAYRRMGHVYEYGRSGISKNWKKALEYYEQGAEFSEGNCLFKLGYAHYTGKGRPKDFLKAMDYWRAAADAGNVDGLTHLGILYSDGKGVEKDVEKAAAYYREATMWGATSSENNHAWMMYENPEIWEPDIAIRMAYNGVQKWECNPHYHTLVKVLMKAERWDEAGRALNQWQRFDMRNREIYDPVAVPEKFKKLRKQIRDERVESHRRFVSSGTAAD